MNYILTFLFILLVFIFYYLIGNLFSHIFKDNNSSFQYKIIFGWLFICAIGWMIGFVFQLFSYSWKSFFLTYSFIIIVILCIVTIYSYIHYKNNLNTKILLIHLKNNLQKHWFVYLLAVIFTILSITNLQPYTINNYQDDSYIVKMVHLIGSPHLLNENYSFGNILDSTKKFGFALQSGHRMFTTYELVYSVLSVITHISTIFFVRVTMTLHNYLICLLVFQIFIELFVDEEKSQYALCLLTILFIPSGYLSKGNVPIRVRMFETWRFQTAIYMGGSIIRLCSVPLLISYTAKLFTEGKARYLLNYIVLFIGLLSFQISIISYYLLFLPFFILGIILFFVWRSYIFDKNEIQNTIIYAAITSAIFIAFILILKQLNSFIGNSNMNILIKHNILRNTPVNLQSIDIKTLTKMLQAYMPYYKNVFQLDFFAKYAVLPILVLLIFCNEKNQRLILCIFAMIYLLIRSNMIDLFLMLVSVEFYGAARILTSILIVALVFFGIMVVKLLDYIPKAKLSMVILSLALMIGNLAFLKTNYQQILKYTESGDGVIKNGYSLMPIESNNKMLAQPFVDVGNYFDKLPGNKYVIFSEDIININGLNYDKQNLLLASKKIMYCYVPYTYEQEKNNVENEKLKNANWLLHKYINNKKENNFYLNYKAIKSQLENDNLNYIFITKEEIKNNLVKNNWKIVCGSNTQKYWLLKLH